MEASKRARACSDSPQTSGSSSVCGLGRCAEDKHQGHTFGEEREERSRQVKLQREARSVLVTSKVILLKQEQKLKDMEESIGLIQAEATEAKDFCEAVLVAVIDSLQGKYLEVRELIESQQRTAIVQVQSCMKDLQEQMEDRRTRNNELHQLQDSDDAEVLQKWPSLKSFWKNYNGQCFPGTPGERARPFKVTERAVEEVGKKLLQLCDAEFASLTQDGAPGVPTLTDQDAELKTRADFLQYACRLSLDPSTAHEDLVISAGFKEVSRNPQALRNPGLQNPEQFLRRRQVLCREGLKDERCYYEMEVRGGKAEVALAYRDIDRKSHTKESAFGANAKSWSLDRSTYYSVSHRGKSVQLIAPPKHQRIGVYLEFREGRLSFYEVDNDSMTFLYRVTAEFTQPLYPGVWLGENCCIKIWDL